MAVFGHWEKILEASLTGAPLSMDDGLTILNAKGADFTALLAAAHHLKEQSFGDRLELCSIINAKSGLCPENCAFCAQSAHYATNTPIYPLVSREKILAAAQQADKDGTSCFGIVTSGTNLEKSTELPEVLAAIQDIRSSTSVKPSASLGIIDSATAAALAEAGCVTYHHNLETARSFFPTICTTHDYEEDVSTVRVAKEAGMQVCSGGIFGLGESLEQRVEMAQTLAELQVDSVPLNFLNPVPGTPLGQQNDLTPLDCLRIIALYRFALPRQRITVCGGRLVNLRDLQGMIMFAGASGVMVGNYLTTQGRQLCDDLTMFQDAEVTIHELCKH